VNNHNLPQSGRLFILRDIAIFHQQSVGTFLLHLKKENGWEKLPAVSNRSVLERLLFQTKLFPPYIIASQAGD